ncbi:MAG TPA: site-specific DNA-methyltransferase [Planctomycetota bacterium]|nr:site-specific DNA-methyltransferase [Planctomycetota bacterium]
MTNMSDRRQKLELTWIGKDERPRLEPRILLEDTSLSYHAPHRVNASDHFDNVLIQGDNLLALKAIEQQFAGRVKCIFIDPPYNTGSAFSHYDDGLEHSTWLSLLRERVAALHSLLRDDGSLWIAIDDNECHYLRVLCDEVFGRAHFVANIVWQSKDTPGNNARGIAQTHNHLLVYRKSEQFRPRLLPRDEKQLATYKNLDGDPRGPWLGTPLTRAEHRDRDYYKIPTPDGRKVLPPPGSSWRRPPNVLKQLLADNRVYWGKDGTAEFPMEKKFLSEVKSGVIPQTWWPYTFAGSTRNASAEMKAIFGGKKVFDTPKPEKLALRVLEIATEVGDLVLDSFLGSGTTAAVAHKAGRRWVGIELGDHAEELCIPRLRSVVDGTDKAGVTQELGWKGGGGFRFYRLAASLLERDQWGNWIVSKAYNAAMLAEAMCKLEGFRYDPDPETFWLHGRSTENDFLYVTTQNLSRAQVQFISEQVGPSRTLLICCGAFRAKRDDFPNLTLKKIPQAVLHRCEWGRDDYSLNVQALPPAEASEEAEVEPAETATAAEQARKSPPPAKAARGKKNTKKPARGMHQLPLFDTAKKGQGTR